MVDIAAYGSSSLPASTIFKVQKDYKLKMLKNLLFLGIFLVLKYDLN